MTHSQGSPTAKPTLRKKGPKPRATPSISKSSTATQARAACRPQRSIDTPHRAGHSLAEREFMRAMDAYKESSGRMFPTWSEVLEVLQHLGYQKDESARGEAGAAEMMGRLHAAGWCVGDSVSESEDGGHLWVVVGRLGKHVLRAEGASQSEAWRSALGQAGASG
jgi:hypothetical protein